MTAGSRVGSKLSVLDLKVATDGSTLSNVGKLPTVFVSPGKVADTYKSCVGVAIRSVSRRSVTAREGDCRILSEVCMSRCDVWGRGWNVCEGVNSYTLLFGTLLMTSSMIPGCSPIS